MFKDDNLIPQQVDKAQINITVKMFFQTSIQMSCQFYNIDGDKSNTKGGEKLSAQFEEDLTLEIRAKLDEML